MTHVLAFLLGVLVTVAVAHVVARRAQREAIAHRNAPTEMLNTFRRQEAIRAIEHKAVSRNGAGEPKPCGGCKAVFASWKARREHLRTNACAPTKAG